MTIRPGRRIGTERLYRRLCLRALYLYLSRSRAIIFTVFIGITPLYQVYAASDEFAEPRTVKVAEPFLEMRTGPGRGYPVFFVVVRDAWITIELRKTDWYRIKTAEGKTGWVERPQLEQTLTPSGAPTQFAQTTRDEYLQHDWELALMTGALSSSTILTLNAAHNFNENLTVETSLSQVLGDLSSSYLVDVNLLSYPFPEDEISPYFTLGMGIIYVNPRAILAQIKDTTNMLTNVGIGFKMYMTSTFFLRAEYKKNVIFTSGNANLEMNEWKIGVGAFY